MDAWSMDFYYIIRSCIFLSYSIGKYGEDKLFLGGWDLNKNYAGSFEECRNIL